VLALLAADLVTAQRAEGRSWRAIEEGAAEATRRLLS
jgi:hypothetical protein